MALQVLLDGQWIDTDAESLRQMALENKIQPDTLIHYADREIRAGKIKGLVFSSAKQPPEQEKKKVKKTIQVFLNDRWVDTDAILLKQMALKNTIQRDTLIRYADRVLYAGKIKGLVFSSVETPTIQEEIEVRIDEKWVPVSRHSIEESILQGTITPSSTARINGTETSVAQILGIDEPSNSDSSKSETIVQMAKKTKLFAKKYGAQVLDQFNEATGVSNMKDISIKEMISEAVQVTKHKESEMEECFSIGIGSNIPPITSVDTSWPRPWLFIKILFAGLIAFSILWFSWCMFKNLNLIPGIIFFGSFIVPFATLIFFFEMNIVKNISMYLTLKLFMIGGALGLLFALIGFRITDAFPVQWLGASIAGLIEEPAKLLVLVFYLFRKKFTDKKYILNGLLLGAAVGAGFAAFESMGYALNSFLIGLFNSESLTRGGKEMFSNLLTRGLLSPFAHIIWTGMCTAALWRVIGDQKMTFGALSKPRFFIVLITAVSLHALWNSAIPGTYFIKYIALGLFGWLIIFGMIGIGIRQVRKLKTEAINEQDLEEDVSIS